MSRALVASPLGFLIGFSMGALGGGGSVLAVPVLVYVVGQSPPATTTSLVVVGLAAVVGMGDHWRAGRVRPGIGVMFGLAGLGGSIGGSTLNRRLDPNVLLLAFAALVLERQRGRRWWIPRGPITGGGVVPSLALGVVPCSWRSACPSGPMRLAGDTRHRRRR